MKNLRANVMTAGMMATALLAAAGCEREATRNGPGLVLRAGTPDPGVAALPAYRLRIVRLQHRVRPDAAVEDVWALLGTTGVPHEKRALWEANDLRLGEGATLAARRFEDLLRETPERRVFRSELFVRENFDFRISLGATREALDFLWVDAEGRLLGRRWKDARADLRVVCRTEPDHPDTVTLAVVPEVTFGKERRRLVQTEGGPGWKMARDRFTLADLAAEVRLAPDRLLVVGGRQRSPVSVGGAYFFERHGPDLWVHTLIVTARRVSAPDAPVGGSVPLVPNPAPEPKPAEPVETEKKGWDPFGWRKRKG